MKRYEFVQGYGDNGWLHEDENGELVKFSEYAEITGSLISAMTLIDPSLDITRNDLELAYKMLKKAVREML